MNLIFFVVQVITMLLLTKIAFSRGFKLPKTLNDEIETSIKHVNSSIVNNQELIFKIEENIQECKRLLEENNGDFEVNKRKFVLLLIEFFNAMHHNITNELNRSKMHLIQLKSIKK